MFADTSVRAAIFPVRLIESFIDSVSNETPPFEHDSVVIQRMVVRIEGMFFILFKFGFFSEKAGLSK